MDHFQFRFRQILKRFGIILFTKRACLELLVVECKGCVSWDRWVAWKKTILPGLGYESGGYVPFLTESLSIQAKAASLISSDAGPDAIQLILRWVKTRKTKHLGNPPELGQIGCRQQMVMEWDGSPPVQSNRSRPLSPPENRLEKWHGHIIENSRPVARGHKKRVMNFGGIMQAQDQFSSSWSLIEEVR